MGVCSGKDCVDGVSGCHQPGRVTQAACKAPPSDTLWALQCIILLLPITSTFPWCISSLRTALACVMHCLSCHLELRAARKAALPPPYGGAAAFCAWHCQKRLHNDFYYSEMPATWTWYWLLTGKRKQILFLSNKQWFNLLRAFGRERRCLCISKWFPGGGESKRKNTVMENFGKKLKRPWRRLKSISQMLLYCVGEMCILKRENSTE